MITRGGNASLPRNSGVTNFSLLALPVSHFMDSVVVESLLIGRLNCSIHPRFSILSDWSVNLPL